MKAPQRLAGFSLLLALAWCVLWCVIWRVFIYPNRAEDGVSLRSFWIGLGTGTVFGIVSAIGVAGVPKD
jgi:hypothetical protein